MSKNVNKDFLEKRLNDLDVSIQKIVNSRSYSKDVSKIKILEQMIKEQLKNENTRSSVG